jgi:ankyrin repeat protein
MMNRLFKSLLFVVLISPLASLAMEPEPKRIAFGKKLVDAVCSNAPIDRIKYLIENGADVNQKDDFGWTPLLLATAKARSDIVKVLIDSDVDLNQRSSEGYTALMLAVIGADREIIKMLLDANCALDVQDNEGRTALMIAAELSPGICPLFVEVLLNKAEEQRERVYAALNCFKKLPCGQCTNLKHLFKPYFREMIHEPRRLLFDEISRLKNDEIKRKLIDFVMLYESQKKSETSFWSNNCAIQ